MDKDPKVAVPQLSPSPQDRTLGWHVGSPAKPCWACKVHKGRCSTCQGLGMVPLKPSVSEWVTYRRPLDPIEIEYMEKDPEAYPPIPKLYPMLVLHSDLCMANSRTVVRVTGYVIRPPMEKQTVRTTWGYGSGTPGEEFDLKVRDEPVMQQIYMREVEGPSPEPGCWNWKGEPS